MGTEEELARTRLRQKVRLRDRSGTVPEYVRLLCAVLLLFVLQASLPETETAFAIEVAVGGAALILALQLARARRSLLRIAGVVVLLAFVGAVINVLWAGDNTTGGAILIVNGLLVAGGPPAVAVAMGRQPTISVRTVLGAMTIYVLIGLFFAFLYRAFLNFNSTSFITGNGDLDPAAMQYFSFITLTTVGFGDITPLSGLARTVVALEGLLGQVYLVTVVALVVGNIGTSFRRPRDLDIDADIDAGTGAGTDAAPE